MHFKKTGLCLATILSSAFFSGFFKPQNLMTTYSPNKIIDQNFKIKQPETLNEILTVLTAEDSRTLPIEIDNNTIIEQFNLYADRTELKGLIITPDFAQFEQDLGAKEVQKWLKECCANCNIFFEHQYQRHNPTL